MPRCMYPIEIRHPTLKKYNREFYESHGYAASFEEEEYFCQVHGIERKLQVPCGHCLYCFQAKQESWRLRLQAEQKDSFSCFFCTLTYAPEFEPKDGVVKSDFQKFMKRFRHNMAIPLRYFAVSEYGPHNTHRPHYHFALFFKDFVSFEDCYNEVDKSWHSITNVEELTDGRISYLSTYCIKFFNEAPVGKNPNFMLCSRKPFIGAGYLDNEVVDVHRHKLEPVVSVNGFKKQMPRIYKEKIYDDDQKIVIRLKQKERESDILEDMKRVKASFTDDLAFQHAISRQYSLDLKRAWRRFKESKKI